jgi:ribosomal protein L37AE/L43A
MPQTAASTFEFTKRKRFADLLVTELSDAIILVLSPSGDIFYVGVALTELLGWTEGEWLDAPLTDYIHTNDRRTFLESFENSIQTGGQISCYVRLLRKLPEGPSAQSPQSTESSSIPYEINGHPKYAPDGTNQCSCYFAVAKPYPGRSAALLGTFLELKMENQKLVERLEWLRSQANEANVQALPPNSSVGYGASVSGTGRQLWQDYSQSEQDLCGNFMQPSTASPQDVRTSSINRGAAPTKLIDEADPSDGGSKKRKLNKILTNASTPQHVCMTCGRTDSPEWRKGPQGPKTLCNACGLRWAKESRKPVEPHDVAMGSATS